MKIRVSQFIDFAYGDKRKDKSKVKAILDGMDMPYEPAKDRYKQFREAMTSFEQGSKSKADFLKLPEQVTQNKSVGYKVLCDNYLDLKEDHALVWEGHSPVVANISGLEVTTAWYLRTEESNRQRVIFLNFRKEQLPRKKERGLLTVLRLAKPDAAGVGILNIQPGTLTTSARLDVAEAAYLKERAAKFVKAANELQT